MTPLNAKTARLWLGAVGLAGALALIPQSAALAQSISLDLGNEGSLTERAIQMVVLITVISLAPSILIMTTSFVRMIVVFGLLRSAIGTQTTPPNAVLVALALFLTAFVMQPVWEASWRAGIQPMIDNGISIAEAFPLAVGPIKAFMLQHVREEDLALFVRLAQIETPPQAADLPVRIVAPAFLVSELRRAFEIGFLVFLPFLVIDLVVASLLLAMGMISLPPVVISLPFKLVFFVLVDGWRLIAGSLVESFIAGPPA